MKSANIGDSTYVGAGAGRWPTAQSVVADILRVKSPWQPAFGTRDVEAGGFEKDFVASSGLAFQIEKNLEFIFLLEKMLSHY